MAIYVTPFTITDRMLWLVSSISEKTERIGARGRLESQPQLTHGNLIRSLHASLAFTGNALPFSDVRNVIDGHDGSVIPEALRAVKNAYTAYGSIGGIDPYSTEDLKKICSIMNSGDAESAGKYRQVPEGVYSGGRCLFVAPPPGMVSGLTDRLFVWMKQNRDTVHPLILSAVFHYEFAFIRPFSEQTESVAMLWHKALLSSWKSVFEAVPLESRIEESREGYHRVIAECSREGKSNGFIEFLLEKTDLALDDVMNQLEKTCAETGTYLKKLLNVMSYDVPYSTAELLDALGLHSRETFRKNYMDPALEQGYVVMSVPDKPTSRNQQYIRKR